MELAVSLPARLSNRLSLDFHFGKIDDNVEEVIIKYCDILKTQDKKIKKELLISNVSDTDQYGFELSSKMLNFLSDNEFILQISGVFV